MSSESYRGRIAPSPNGYLHLGHAKTFWTAFKRCRDASGHLIYRDEDIDPNRCKKEYSDAAVEDLTRLGITWDEGPLLQSERIKLYAEKLTSLIKLNLVYPCSKSRREIREYSGLKKSPFGETLFPKSWSLPENNDSYALDRSINWRFRVHETDLIEFIDLKQGPQVFRGRTDFADFLVWRKEGVPAYELAVVVDDIDMKITEVVRGQDLLLSTARQWLLYKAFNATPPVFYHEDLVNGADGKRLSKRSRSIALRTLFEQGHDRESLFKSIPSQ